MGEPGSSGENSLAPPISERPPPALEYLNRTKWECTRPLVPCDRLLGRIDPPARWRKELVRTQSISEHTGKPLPKLALKHWVKGQIAEPQQIAGGSEMLNYSDEEYELHLQDPTWTRQQTDRLFEMCSRFDLRFMAIYDRFTCPGPGEPDEEEWLELEQREVEGTDIIASKHKTMESLKDRFYSIQKTLFTIRNRSDSDARQINACSFNPHYEAMRKEQLSRLLQRSQDQVLGMAELVLEHRRLQRGIKALKKDHKLKDKQRKSYASHLSTSLPVSSSSSYLPSPSSFSASSALPALLPALSIPPPSSSSSTSSATLSSCSSWPSSSPHSLSSSQFPCSSCPKAGTPSFSTPLSLSSSLSTMSPCLSGVTPTTVHSSTHASPLPSKLTRVSSSGPASSPAASPLARSSHASLPAQTLFPSRTSGGVPGSLCAIPDQCLARRATRPAVPGCVLRSSTVSGPPPLQTRHLPKQLEPELVALGFKAPKLLPSATGQMCEQFDQLRADIVTLINLEAYVKKAEAERDALRSVGTPAIPSNSGTRKKDKRTLETERTADKKRRP